MISKYLFQRFMVKLKFDTENGEIELFAIPKVKGSRSNRLYNSPESGVNYDKENKKFFYIKPSDISKLSTGDSIISVGADNYSENPYIIKYINPNAYRLGKAEFYIIECENDRTIKLSEGGIL